MKTLKEVIVFLSTVDTPLGYLCSDILSFKNFPYDDIEKAWAYLNHYNIKNDDYFNDPIRRLKTVYSTIIRS